MNLLRAELATALDVKVVAVWNHRFGKGPRRTELYSNGRVGDADGKSTWTFDEGVLTFFWADPRAAGGGNRDVCSVAPDGASYAGKNQKGHKVSGDYLAK